LVVVEVGDECREGGKVGATVLVDESNVAQRTVNLHDILHADLLSGCLGKEGVYALKKLETFSLGDRYGAFGEVPFQSDIYEEVTEI
jgi:hypothetical protein